MNEIERLTEQLESAFSGSPWYGPSVHEVLDGVTAETAARRPMASAHNIWEIVVHMTVWKNVVCRRIQGDSVDPTPEEDWPAVTVFDDREWLETLAALNKAHERLVSDVRGFDPARLHVVIPGRKTDAYFQINGAAQHDIYHAGQIAVLRK
jgi:uncharacterized damage-inducible protein DinB